MECRYNCLSARYKQPFGCVKETEKCRMTVEVSAETRVGLLEVILESEQTGCLRVPLHRGRAQHGFVPYTAEFTLPRCDLYFYHFVLQCHDGAFRLLRDGETGVGIDFGERWQITCYAQDFLPPAEFAGAVMYQIFPDRFYKGRECDLSDKLKPYYLHKNWGDTPDFRPNSKGQVLNNGFFGGNLDGIRQKLPYLHDLNVEVIYLNPICMAFSNHRYDTADYKRIDPILGNDQDLAALCREAHALGMKVILDGVYSHTGSNSVYFDKEGVFGCGAYSDPRSPYYSWYNFQHYPDKYTCWWNFDTLPCVNEMEPSYLDFLIRNEDSVIAHWLGLGVDGFRLDVADELPDEFIAMFRKRVKELNPNAIVLGEVWEDASNKVAYGVRRKYFSNSELDSVMNYPFRDAILAFMSDGNAEHFRVSVMKIVEHYPTPVLHCLMNALSTHDTPRILTLLGDSFNGSKEEKAERYLDPQVRPYAVAREIAAAVLQFTLPGMASIYYGDEAGSEGFEDPLNRRCFPWGKEDQALMDFYRKLTQLKTSLPALRTGELEFLPAPEGVIDFVRTVKGQRVRVIVNGSDMTVDPPLCGQLLFLHFGRQSGPDLLLDQWGVAVMLENSH